MVDLRTWELTDNRWLWASWRRCWKLNSSSTRAPHTYGLSHLSLQPPKKIFLNHFYFLNLELVKSLLLIKLKISGLATDATCDYKSRNEFSRPTVGVSGVCAVRSPPSWRSWDFEPLGFSLLHLTVLRSGCRRCVPRALQTTGRSVPFLDKPLAFLCHCQAQSCPWPWWRFSYSNCCCLVSVVLFSS